jgi:hypothetical protein
MPLQGFSPHTQSPAFSVIQQRRFPNCIAKSLKHVLPNSSAQIPSQYSTYSNMIYERFYGKTVTRIRRFLRVANTELTVDQQRLWFLWGVIKYLDNLCLG